MLKSWFLKLGNSFAVVQAGIYPLQSVFIHKAKIIKAPKFDLTKLMEVHGDVDYAAENEGSKMDR